RNTSVYEAIWLTQNFEHPPSPPSSPQRASSFFLRASSAAVSRFVLSAQLFLQFLNTSLGLPGFFLMPLAALGI
ncbi:hypothetical protein OQJ46_13515, partial [Microbulbifer thermotolerans]